MDQIFLAVSSLNSASSGGPDGFNVKFFQSCWNIIKDNICETVWDFWDGNPCPPQVPNTLIIPIPKIQHPQSWGDFRYISLSNVFCRILSKLIYSCIQHLLPTIISKEQGVFVEWRNIVDNIIVVQDLVNGFNSSNNLNNSILK